MPEFSKVSSQLVAVELNSTNSRQQDKSDKHYGVRCYGKNERDIIFVLYLSHNYTSIAERLVFLTVKNLTERYKITYNYVQGSSFIHLKILS